MKNAMVLFLLETIFCSCGPNCGIDHCINGICEKCTSNYFFGEMGCIPCSETTCGSCDGGELCTSCKKGMYSGKNETDRIKDEYSCTRCMEEGKVFSSGKCYEYEKAGCSGPALSGDIYRRCKAKHKKSCILPFAYDENEKLCYISHASPVCN